MLALTRDRNGPARLGLAIAKKSARRAIDRNRLKRVVREVFRHNRQSLPGIDLVVMARSPAAAADMQSLRTSLERHFTQLAAQLGVRPVDC